MDQQTALSGSAASGWICISEWGADMHFENRADGRARPSGLWRLSAPARSDGFQLIDEGAAACGATIVGSAGGSRGFRGRSSIH
jgi:hypothetical protein